LRWNRPTITRRISVVRIAATIVIAIGTPTSRSQVPSSRNASTIPI
jgi:hypothetical protein